MVLVTPKSCQDGSIPKIGDNRKLQQVINIQKYIYIYYIGSTWYWMYLFVICCWMFLVLVQMLQIHRFFSDFLSWGFNEDQLLLDPIVIPKNENRLLLCIIKNQNFDPYRCCKLCISWFPCFTLGYTGSTQGNTHGTFAKFNRLCSLEGSFLSMSLGNWQYYGD